MFQRRRSLANLDIYPCRSCFIMNCQELKCSLKKCSIKFYEEIFMFFLTKLRPFFEFEMLLAFFIFFHCNFAPKTARYVPSYVIQINYGWQLYIILLGVKVTIKIHNFCNSSNPAKFQLVYIQSDKLVNCCGCYFYILI